MFYVFEVGRGGGKFVGEGVNFDAPPPSRPPSNPSSNCVLLSLPITLVDHAPTLTFLPTFCPSSPSLSVLPSPHLIFGVLSESAIIPVGRLSIYWSVSTSGLSVTVLSSVCHPVGILLFIFFVLLFSEFLNFLQMIFLNIKNK